MSEAPTSPISEEVRRERYERVKRHQNMLDQVRSACAAVGGYEDWGDEVVWPPSDSGKRVLRVVQTAVRRRDSCV